MKNSNIKKILSILLMLVFTLSLLPASVFAAADKNVTLTIIHVNDRHGRMGADPYISELVKNTKGNVLVLDAGDALHGQITTNLSEGAAMVELMNKTGYNAMTTGNHEYTYGINRLLELSEMMDFPLLAANVKGVDGKALFDSCVTFQMDGIKVGVFGLATPETIASSDPRNMTGLVFDDSVKTAETEVAELKASGCDIIIALTHMGMDGLSNQKDRSDNLAAAVPGIDVIIDGHSHTALPEGLTVGNTLIAQTGEYGGNIGVVEITISGDKTLKTAKLIPLDSDGLKADEAILAKIAELDAANEAVTSVVVGSTPVLLHGEKAESRTGGTNLADLITDSMRYATDADMAFMTGGNIRASIDTGDITMGEVLTTLPYSNLIVTVELTGADILKILEHGVDTYPEAAGHYIHVSGINFSFNPDAESGGRIKTVTLSDGKALLPKKTYTVATIDFIAAGGDGYDMANSKNLKYYGGDAEAFINYLAIKPKINAEPEGRVSALLKDALYVVMPDATHGFLGESIRHAEDELKKLAAETGLAYKLYKTADATLQSDALNEAVKADAGAVVLWPITGEPLREAAEKVMDAGVPLIIYDRLIEGFTPDSEVLGDNMKIARMAGKYFNEYFSEEIASGKKINILELAGDDSTVPKQRTQGFIEIAGDNANVVKSFNTQWQREVAREKMTKWLKTASVADIESIQAIYSHEDETVLGAMDAIAAYNGKAKLNIRLIIGLGGKRDLIMHTGYYKEHFGIDLVTYQFSPAMIRDAIKDGALAAAGKSVAAEHLIDTFEIDRNTLGTYLESKAYKTRYTTAMPKIDGVPSDAWYSFAVSSRAIEAYSFMTSGGMFNPDELITEELASTILSITLPYSKTSIKSGELLTREKLAAMLMEALSGYELAETGGALLYTDAGLIGNGYKDAVDYVYKTGLMRGLGGGRFNPQGTVTAAQMATVICNAMNACLNSAARTEGKTYSALSDFSGTVIGTVYGTVFEEFINPVIPNVTYKHYASVADTEAALSSGEIDAFAIDLPIAKYITARNVKFTIFPDVVAGDRYGFAVKKGSPLAKDGNEALKKIIESSVVSELEKTWFSTRESVKTLPENTYKRDFDGSAGTIRFGYANGNIPMSYVDVNGKPAGFDLDIVSRIAYELNMAVEFVPMSFDELFAALDAGEIDMAGGSMSITDERLKTYDFIGPSYDGGVVLVVRK